jgi:hypothetical protein
MVYEHLCCLIISAFGLSNFVDPVSSKVYTNIIRGTLSLPFVPYLTQESLLVETARFVTTDVTFLVYLEHVYVPLINNLIYWCIAQIGFRLFLVLLMKSSKHSCVLQKPEVRNTSCVCTRKYVLFGMPVKSMATKRLWRAISCQFYYIGLQPGACFHRNRSASRRDTHWRSACALRSAVSAGPQSVGFWSTASGSLPIFLCENKIII